MIAKFTVILKVIIIAMCYVTICGSDSFTSFSVDSVCDIQSRLVNKCTTQKEGLFRTATDCAYKCLQDGECIGLSFGKGAVCFHHYVCAVNFTCGVGLDMSVYKRGFTADMTRSDTAGSPASSTTSVVAAAATPGTTVLTTTNVTAEYDETTSPATTLPPATTTTTRPTITTTRPTTTATRPPTTTTGQPKTTNDQKAPKTPPTTTTTPPNTPTTAPTTTLTLPTTTTTLPTTTTTLSTTTTTPPTTTATPPTTTTTRPTTTTTLSTTTTVPPTTTTTPPTTTATPPTTTTTPPTTTTTQPSTSTARTIKICQNNGTWDSTSWRCVCNNGWVGDTCETRAKGCQDIADNGYSRGWPPHWIYIEVEGISELLHVRCQLRDSYFTLYMMINQGKVSHNRSWNEYENGYLLDNYHYWMGLKGMKRLNQLGHTTVFLDTTFIYPFGSTSSFQCRYDDFHFDTAITSYAFQFSQAVLTKDGNYSAKLQHQSCLDTLKGVQFSTWDRDNDGDPWKNCAAISGVGWWFKGCDMVCNPMGLSYQYNNRVWDPRQYLKMAGLNYTTSEYANEIAATMYFSVNLT